MRYAIKTLVGLGLIAAATTVTAFAVYRFGLIIGCVSGAPVELKDSCSARTQEPVFYLLFGGIAANLLGMGIFAGRGWPPGGAGSWRASAGLVMWCPLFTGMSFALFWAVLGPDAYPGGDRFVGLLLGFMFGLMGLVALPMLFAGLGSQRGRPVAGASQPSVQGGE